MMNTDLSKSKFSINLDLMFFIYDEANLYWRKTCLQINTKRLIPADYHPMPNNKRKQSRWGTLRKTFQSKKKMTVQNDSVDNNDRSNGSLESLYAETTNAASVIISESSSTTSHSMDEAFPANVCPIKARPLPPIPLDTGKNSKNKPSLAISLNDEEIFAKMSSYKFKVTEFEPELAYKLFLVMVSHFAPNRENDADMMLKKLFDCYKEYVDIDIYDEIPNKSQRSNTDSLLYQNFSVFSCEKPITDTASIQNGSTSEKTEDTASENLYMDMQPPSR